MSAGNQRVMVAVRVRPVITDGAELQNQEKFELQGVYRTGDTALRVEITKQGEPAKSSMFNFDYIFDQESTQLEVYEDCVVDMVDAALVGINGTILAYGQTGSGKTFTVLGDVKPNPLENDLLTTNSGMFLRVLSDLMDYKQRQLKKGWHVVVALSCVEVYNTAIRDLFGGKPGQDPPTLKPIMIGDDVLLPNLIIREMTTLQAVFNEIQLAISRRKSRDTDANSGSSRSHCLFTVDVLQQATTAPAPSIDILMFDRKNAEEKSSRKSSAAGVSPTSKKAGTGGTAILEQPKHPWEMAFHGSLYRIPGQKEPIYLSKLILADLAGSERIARTHVQGAGLAEATAINSSLTALGNVVHSLHEGGFVGYRDSSLTRLLKPTFSQPTSRVLLIAQCSPTQLTFDETVSTLHFANKVKAMKVTTTTGAEAERLQFDYLELEKTYDSIVADLHVFSVLEFARPSVIHRKLTQNRGLYYDANITGKGKITTRDRKATVDGMGAIAAAQHEKQEIQAEQDCEKAYATAKTRAAIDEARDSLVQEHLTNTAETRESIQTETDLREHHASQEMLLDASALGNLIVNEEAAEWAALASRFTKAHHAACKAEITNGQKLFDGVCREVNRSRLSAASHETPETQMDNEQYAIATWGHTTAKRFFSSCMELREDHMSLLSINRGNAALEKWRDENQDTLRKFQDGSLA